MGRWNQVAVGQVISQLGRWQEDTINDVCNTIGGHVVSSDNLGLVRVYVALVDGHEQLFALDSLYNLFWLQVGREHLGWQHVVCQDVNQLALVLWLQESVECACWERSKGFVGWGEDSERSRRAESLNKVTSHDCCHQGREVIH